MRHLPAAGLSLALFLLSTSSAFPPSFAQSLQRPREQVEVLPVEPVTVSAAAPAKLQVTFRVLPGFHINSHKPSSELLIPTSLTVTAAPPLVAGKVLYPEGHEFALPIAPEEKLNVYSGEVTLQLPVSVGKSAAAGSHHLQGLLEYQACNDNSCFPPRRVPIDAVVNVKK